MWLCCLHSSCVEQYRAYVICLLGLETAWCIILYIIHTIISTLSACLLHQIPQSSVRVPYFIYTKHAWHNYEAYVHCTQYKIHNFLYIYILYILQGERHKSFNSCCLNVNREPKSTNATDDIIKLIDTAMAMIAPTGNWFISVTETDTHEW